MGDTTAIKLVFGGDFAPVRGYESLIDLKGGAIFGDARTVFKSSDFVICNLEAPLCLHGSPISKVGPHLRAQPNTLKALVEAGVQAVCLANNHIFDYGAEGLAETVALLDEHGIAHAGAGLSRPEAEAPIRLNIGGKLISIFSFAEREFNLSETEEAGAANLDPLRVGPLLASERHEVDAVIVCFHGGNEYFAYPRPGLRRMCHYLVEMGADAVIGHHPHVPGPYETFKGKPIVYSLGNLVFDHAKPPSGWSEGYFAEVSLLFNSDNLDNVVTNIVPYKQSSSSGGVKLMDGAEKETFIERILEMRNELENSPGKWINRWNEFVDQKRSQAIINLVSPVRFRGLRRVLDLKAMRKILSPESRRLHRLNLLRCDSHRELLTAVFERRFDR